MLRAWKFSDSQWTDRKSTGHNAKERSATNSATMRFIMPALTAVVYALVYTLKLIYCARIYVYIPHRVTIIHT